MNSRLHLVIAIVLMWRPGSVSYGGTPGSGGSCCAALQPQPPASAERGDGVGEPDINGERQAARAARDRAADDKPGANDAPRPAGGSHVPAPQPPARDDDNDPDAENDPQNDPETPQGSDDPQAATASDDEPVLPATVEHPAPAIPDLTPSEALYGSQLTNVARFEMYQPTGIAASEDHRIFLNFPLWSDSYLFAVVELTDDGRIELFPDGWSNAWRESRSPIPADEAFVSVQSVWADGRGGLWVLDSGSPRMEKIIPGGPKLVRIQLDNSDVIQTIHFDSEIVPEGCYLNDVRVDLDRQYAYITDSGLGAIIVIDLQHEIVRRVLGEHPSTKAEADLAININGRPWRTSEGATPQIHVDGLALSHDGEYLYYHALSGRTLYRIATAVLRDPATTTQQLDEAVEPLARTVVTDGLAIDAAGNVYHTALEHDAIVRYTPDGQLQTIVRDYSIIWPDSLAFGADGWLYFTTSQIHQMPRFNDGKSRRFAPYQVMKVSLVPPPPEPAEATEMTPELDAPPDEEAIDGDEVEPDMTAPDVDEPENSPN